MRARNVLDGFFHPDSLTTPAAAVEVLRSVAALCSADAEAASRSQGCIVSAGFLSKKGQRWSADRGGIASEIIFGPLLDFACRCGKYVGKDRAGTSCERCGVLCGSSALRNERFGHLVLPGGVVHPVLAPIIGEVLGITADEVQAVARCEAWLTDAGVVRVETPLEDYVADRDAMGAQALADRLASAPPVRHPPELVASGFSCADLLVELVPVIPPGDRPLIETGDPTVLAPQPGPVNEAYRALTSRALRLARLRELAAPEIILRNEARLMQRAFDTLYATVIHHSQASPSAAPFSPPRPWQAANQAKEEPRIDSHGACAPQDFGDPYLESPPDPTLPCGCLWLDEERILVQFPSTALVVSRKDGQVISRHPVSRLSARATDAAGQRVVFLGEHPCTTESGALRGVAVLDTQTGEWLASYPAELRAVTVVNDQPEDAFLYNLRSGESRAIESDSDRPGLYAMSADQRFVWVGGSGSGGAIVNTDTAIVHLELEESSFDPSDGPFLLRDGSLLDELPDDDRPEDEEIGAAAFALTPTGVWRLVDEEGVVREGNEKRFGLAFPRHAAAFDPRGERLLILTEDEALLIAIAEPPVILERFDLSPLQRLLAPDAAS